MSGLPPPHQRGGTGVGRQVPPYCILHNNSNGSNDNWNSFFKSAGGEAPPGFAPIGISRQQRNVVHLLMDRQRGGASCGFSSDQSTSSGTKFLPRLYDTVSSVKREFTETTAKSKSRKKSKPVKSYQTLVSTPHTISKGLGHYAEFVSVTRFQSAYLPLTYNTVSTISIAFSADGKTLASTHGDHTVKITCCYSGRILTVCTGHPRTPWTVKFHPTRHNIVASGCLGFQVRLWDVQPPLDDKPSPHSATCLHMIRLQYAIISLSFHPRVDLLAIASGTSLHLWDYNQIGLAASSRAQETASALAAAASSQANGTRSQSIHRRNSTDRNESSSLSYQATVEWRHPEALRCVHFTPDGASIIIGGVNPPQANGNDESSRESQQTTTFSLKLWDFHVEKVLPHNGLATLDMERGTLNARMFVSRALLYNDGGFDVSPCGRYLVCCADIWLPFGMDCAMELYSMEEQLQNSIHDLPDDEDDDAQDEENMDLDSEDRGDKDEPDHDALMKDCAECEKSVEDESLEENIEVFSSPCLSQQQQQHHHHQPVSLTHQAHDPMLQMPNLSSISPTRRHHPPHHNTARLGHPSTPHTPPPLPSRLTLSPPSPPGRRLQRYMLGPPLARRTGPAARTAAPAGTTASMRSARSHLPRREEAIRTNPAASGRESADQQRMWREPGSAAATDTPGTSTGSVSSASVPMGGRYVPHVVLVTLPLHDDRNHSPTANTEDATPKPGSKSNLHQTSSGTILHAAPLERSTAVGVTCVKFSPLAKYCLLGYGVREAHARDGEPHRVTALYQVEGMLNVATLTSTRDDVNIARFHPVSGQGFVYGTKQGRVRVLSCKPWVRTSSS